MNPDDLTPGMIIEYLSPSTNAKGNIIDGGGIFGTGRFVQAITRRKSKQIDIVLKNNLGDKTIIKPGWIREERTKHYNMKEWERKNWDSVQDRRRTCDDEPLSGRA